MVPKIDPSGPGGNAIKTLSTLAHALLLLPLLFGCGGDSAEPTDTGPTGLQGASLTVTSSASMGRVGVAGLPSAKSAADSLVYRVHMSAEGAPEMSTWLDHDADGWFFYAPLHPTQPNQGGSMQVRISLGEESSPEFPLEVSALPATPGAFANLVATMRQHLEQRAGAAGTSIAELKATAPGDLSPGLLPLKIAQCYLDTDDPSYDLTELAANQDGILSAEEVTLLDGIFGYFELQTLLQMEIDDWPAAGKSLVFSSSGKLAGCIDVSPDITTAPELSIAMTRSAVAEFGADPESDAGKILKRGAQAFTVLSLFPVVGAPAGAAGVVIGGVQAATEFTAGVLPSYFKSLQFTLNRDEFNEDSLDHATWSNVKVVASSSGWSADKALASAVINSFGTYLSAAGKAQILESDFLRDLTALDIGLGAGIVFNDSDIIEFCSHDWTIDISSPLYCTAAALQHHFDVDIQAQEATPKEAGDDQLRVAAQSTQFGGREIHADVPMVVHAIQVDVTPGEYTVSNPGETVDLTATINHADLTTLRWTTAAGSWDDGIGTDTNQGGTRPLKTPTSPSAYPFLVTVESLSRNGARSSGLPPRVGFATIRYGDSLRIHIEPQYACISPGETLRFTAEVTGLQDYTVLWSIADGYGSIDSDGLYHSLSGGTSSAVIEARIEGHEEVYDQANVDASACTCMAAIEITGDYVWNQGTSQIAYSISSLGDLFYQFFVEPGTGNPTISANIGGADTKPSPRPGDTGTWKVGFVFVAGDQSWTSIWQDVPLPGVSLNLTELTETSMTGSFTGNAFQLDQNGDISSIIGVNVQFRAGYWDGGAWPCE